MSIKQDNVLGYIKGLSTGDRVSVRSLAEKLGVSEGTAYKSIKLAESMGLVATKPKVGTVRITQACNKSGDILTLGDAAQLLGASFASGAQHSASRMVSSLMIIDGSKNQLRDALLSSPRPTLCIVGDRLELQLAALSMGADILITGGAKPSPRLLSGVDSERCVLVTWHDSYTSIGILRGKQSDRLPRGDLPTVRDWMRPPLYLYKDDIVADWHRLYYDLFTEYFACAVVDDDLNICGALDAMSAMKSVPQQKVSKLISDAENCCEVDESVSMQELSDKLIKQKKMLAYVSKDDRMSGIISAGDVMRYYQYANASGSRGFSAIDSRLELISESDSIDRRVYSLCLPAPEQGDSYERGFAIEAALAAARLHSSVIFGSSFQFSGGTFYTPRSLSSGGDFMISSEIMKRSGNDCFLEIEMYDDASFFVKCTLTASAPDIGGEGG